MTTALHPQPSTSTDVPDVLRRYRLAISLMFGEIASLLISRMAVPVLYFMVNNKPVRA